MVGVLKQPDFDGSACGVVPVGFAVDFEKDFLGDVFGLTGIAEDVDCDSMHEPSVPAEQRAERLAVLRLQFGDKLSIRRRRDRTRRPVRPHRDDTRLHEPTSIDVINVLTYPPSVVHLFAGLRYTPRVPRRKSILQRSPVRPAVLSPLGKQLRSLRIERKLSQERLAELAGLNYKYIGRIELGKADPGADVLVRLARALTVTVGELFDTITPERTASERVSFDDIESISNALSALNAVVARVLDREPRPLTARAPRQSRR
jgi:transcriptional regulator with XRE-family HTH domain